MGFSEFLSAKPRVSGSGAKKKGGDDGVHSAKEKEKSVSVISSGQQSSVVTVDHVSSLLNLGVFIDPQSGVPITSASASAAARKRRPARGNDASVNGFHLTQVDLVGSNAEASRFSGSDNPTSSVVVSGRKRPKKSPASQAAAAFAAAAALGDAVPGEERAPRVPADLLPGTPSASAAAVKAATTSTVANLRFYANPPPESDEGEVEERGEG
jgi:hypothetical protein